MGTRNSTIVKVNEKIVVAQYGQWDGYPSGQGLIILETLSNCNLEELKEKCSNVRQIKDYKLKYLWSEAHDLAGEKEDDNKFGFVSVKVADKFKSMHPHLHRDCGGQILSLILKGADEVSLNIDFAKGSGGFFGCEWCYVVDFDKNVLEVYSGTYEEVYLVKGFDLNSLPNEEEFLEECQANQED
jgi:hypothetical protein